MGTGTLGTGGYGYTGQIPVYPYPYAYFNLRVRVKYPYPSIPVPRTWVRVRVYGYLTRIPVPAGTKSTRTRTSLVPFLRVLPGPSFWTRTRTFRYGYPDLGSFIYGSRSGTLMLRVPVGALIFTSLFTS